MPKKHIRSDDERKAMFANMKHGSHTVQSNIYSQTCSDE
jgi:hypothetical protein